MTPTNTLNSLTQSSPAKRTIQLSVKGEAFYAQQEKAALRKKNSKKTLPEKKGELIKKNNKSHVIKKASVRLQRIKVSDSNIIKHQPEAKPAEPIASTSTRATRANSKQLVVVKKHNTNNVIKKVSVRLQRIKESDSNIIKHQPEAKPAEPIVSTSDSISNDELIKQPPINRPQRNRTETYKIVAQKYTTNNTNKNTKEAVPVNRIPRRTRANKINDLTEVEITDTNEINSIHEIEVDNKIKSPLRNTSIKSVKKVVKQATEKKDMKLKEKLTTKSKPSVQEVPENTPAIVQNKQPEISHPVVQNKSPSVILKRQPIYKTQSTTPTTSPETTASPEKENVYDYDPECTFLMENSMKDIIDKLHREKKITLKNKIPKKTASKKAKTNSNEKRTRMKFKSILKKHLQRALKDTNKTKPIDDNVAPIADNDHHDYDDNLPAWNEIEIVDPVPVARINLPSTSATASATSSTTSSNNYQIKKAVPYKMTLNMPKFQSTPLRAPPLKPLSAPAPNASPWRVTDTSIPTTFYFSTSSDHLPTYSSDVIVTETTKSKAQNKINQIASGSEKTNVNNLIIVTPERSHEEIIRNISGGNSVTTVAEIHCNTLNGSNVENEIPPNHNEMVKQGATKIVLDKPNKLIRSPLKTLAIKNVYLSPIDSNDEIIIDNSISHYVSSFKNILFRCQINN